VSFEVDPVADQAAGCDELAKLVHCGHCMRSASETRAHDHCPTKKRNELVDTALISPPEIKTIKKSRPAGQFFAAILLAKGLFAADPERRRRLTA
jgi:hypothetical protein